MNKEDNKATNTLSDNKKITIINIAVLTLVGTNFKPKVEKIQSWGENAQEKAFTQEVFDTIQEYAKGVKINSKFREQLKIDLYDRFGVSKEVQTQDRQKRAQMADSVNEDIAKKKAEWAKQDAQAAQKLNIGIQLQKNSKIREQTQQSYKTTEITRRGQQEGRKEQGEYKRGLYDPHLIATSNKTKQERLLIKLNKRKSEDIVDYEYEYAGTQYTIRRTGELLYKTFVGVEDSISEYEITMRREDRVLTVRKFGHISVPTMEYESYRTEVFTTLLGKNNMEDPELHSYMGSLEGVQGPARGIQPYKIAYSPEEYTAVMLFEELERQQARNAKLEEDRASGENTAR